VWELALAFATVHWGGPVVGAAVAVTFAGFLGFVVAAVRRGAACGCWASLTEGPAGGAELARTGVLATAATVVAVTGWPSSPQPAALGWAAATLAVVWLAAVLGGLIAPVRSPKVADRLALRGAPTRRGRLLARLAFLLGFVHTGTDAERDRLLTALMARQAHASPRGGGRRTPPPRPGTGPSKPSAQNASA
jgi:hypothetical protein